jgi:thioredoxin-related protein
MPYKKLTQKNAKATLDKEKDKIVLFTMIGCPYCQQLKPEWDKAIKESKKDKNIFVIERSIIPYIDPSYTEKIYGFPTIVKFSETKSVKQFPSNKKRTMSNIVKFIEG